MKIHDAFLLIVILLCACSEQADTGPVLLGHQHMRCDRLFDLNEDETPALATPADFSVTPMEAILLAESKADFKCGHKLGAQIYVDDKRYYLLRLSGHKRLNIQKMITQIVAIVDGNSGNVWKVESRM